MNLLYLKRIGLYIPSLILSCLPFIVFGQFELPEGYKLRDFYKGKYICDSCVVYQLPFVPGKKVWIAQGYNGCFSHKRELSLDFKVKVGTPIHAARSGVIYAIKEDSDVHGLKKEYLTKGNYVIIEHEDDTYAGYWHLRYEGVAVELGDTVQAGDLIAYSGHTGYSSMPHLHFFVYRYKLGLRYTIPTPFATKRGLRYLRAWRFYRKAKLED